ncbi:MAG: 50S ribosomal protein L15e, partial [Nanoarchaeota archaeon]
MGLYKYLQQNWTPELYRQRLIEWRRGNSVTRVENPTRLDRAHA